MYVLSGNKLWCWQVDKNGKVNVNGSIWSVRYQFGDNPENPKGPYEVGVVVEGDKAKVSPLHNLPEGAARMPVHRKKKA